MSRRRVAGEPQLPASIPADVAAFAKASASARATAHKSAGQGRPPFVVAIPRFVASWLFECCRAATMLAMRQNTTLVVASLLSLLLLTLHITDDIVRGISKAESSNTALIVFALLLYGTLVLAERRSGHIIMLLVGLFAAAMPVIHMRGVRYSEIAASPGGFFFVWTLWALGGLGGITLILSAQGLWRLRRGQLPR